MKTMYKYILSAIFMLMAGQTLQAQEAFYIYRNDGDFNGFFFDEVKSMGYSKLDLDSVEHDVYVVQEIELEDTIYRIPLAAIDSIGFQQPDIIINENVKEQYEYGGYCGGVVDTTMYEIYWSGYNETSPKVGDIIYASDAYNITHKNDGILDGWSGPYLARVREVKASNRVEPGGRGGEDPVEERILVMEPIENLEEIFNQFISVESVTRDESGQQYVRTAGLNKLRRRVSSNNETGVSFSGDIPIKLGNDNFYAKITVGLTLDVKVRACYNIGWGRGVFASVELDTDLSSLLTFEATADLNKEPMALKQPAIPIPPLLFPSFLPIFEYEPKPGAFLRFGGTYSLKVTTPKYSIKTHTRLTLNSKAESIWSMISGEFPKPKMENGKGKDSEAEVACILNGFVQFGTYAPAKVKTCSFFDKWMSVDFGADLYFGPKLTANIQMNPNGGDFDYGALKNTGLGFALSLDQETTASYKIANWFGEKDKKGKITLFEGGTELFKTSLAIVPDFSMSEYEVEERNMYEAQIVDGQEVMRGLVYPRGYSLKCHVGLVALDEAGKLQGVAEGNQYMNIPRLTPFGPIPTVDESQFRAEFDAFRLPMGKYTICPAVFMAGNIIPATEYATEYECKELNIRNAYLGGNFGIDRFVDTLYVTGVGDPADTDLRFSFPGYDSYFYASVHETRPLPESEFSQRLENYLDPKTKKPFEKIDHEWVVVVHMSANPFGNASSQNCIESKPVPVKVSVTRNGSTYESKEYKLGVSHYVICKD